MTDLEKLRDLLTGFGLTWKEEPYSSGEREERHISVTDGTILYLSEKDNGVKAAGYLFFYADFIFDHDGAFVQVGFWE
jgi:hypothetical protein